MTLLQQSVQVVQKSQSGRRLLRAESLQMLYPEGFAGTAGKCYAARSLSNGNCNAGI
jgi:hypothetical protein